MANKTEKYKFKDDGLIPNNGLPVVIYRNILTLPSLLPANFVRRLFKSNGWTNTWRNGIYTYLHYHTITHEAMAVFRGEANIQLGGPKGKVIRLRKGDVIIIPAGVAHRNMDNEKDIICIGGYPEGKDFDMNYGKKRERKRALHNIKSLPIPDTDPVKGKNGIPVIWKRVKNRTGSKK